MVKILFLILPLILKHFKGTYKPIKIVFVTKMLSD